MIFLLKNFRKKSLKAKILIILFIVVVLFLLAYVLYSNFKPDPPAEYELANVSYGTMVNTLDVNGTVESEYCDNFYAVEGVAVEEVLVNVGDRVQKGDKLATFNTSAVSGYLSAAQKEYNEALSEYNSAKSEAQSSASEKASLEKQIASVNSQIAAKEKEIAELEKSASNSEPVTETVTVSQEQIALIAAQMAQNGATQEQIDTFTAAASQVKIPAVSEENSQLSQELIEKNLELAQLNSKLASLQAQNAVTVSGDSETLLDALNRVVELKKKNYDSVKEVYDKMQNGWFADCDGIVTAVNIKAGENFVCPAQESSSSLDLSSLLGGISLNSSALQTVTSLLGDSQSIPSGIGVTVESYDDMFVTVTVNKSDLLKIEKGMEATVTSLDKEYKGEVTYVGAKAVESDSLDLSSITSSLMGSGSSGGAIVKIRIENPDENVVIGFDVDIKIKLATVEGVLKVPVESVLYDSGTYSVYVYNSEDGTVKRQTITKGAIDDTNYEVTEGLKEGDRVVKSPDPKMEDGTKIKEKTA